MGSGALTGSFPHIVLRDRDNLISPFLFFVAKPTILTAENHQTAMKIRIFTILIFIKICVISAQTILNVEY